MTGRWEALESETDDDAETRDATERMRRHLPEQTIVVEEQHAERVRPAQAEAEPPARRAAAPRPQRPAAPADETLSSQTVINLDQADAVAEADFHIAYGLYDQAAELVQKALEAAPDRRDLKLKLLEVYFMWGNKDSFLKAAQALRADIGQGDDPDWNKVVIMGRQICPDERLFTEATTGGGRVDVDLEAGDSPLDLAFDDASADVAAAASAGLDLNLESSDVRPAPRPAAKKAPPRDFGGDALDIGARTAAGLEAALFEDLEKDDDASAYDARCGGRQPCDHAGVADRRAAGELRLGHGREPDGAVFRRRTDRRDTDDRKPRCEVRDHDVDEDRCDSAALGVADGRATRADARRPTTTRPRSISTISDSTSRISKVYRAISATCRWRRRASRTRASNRRCATTTWCSPRRA